MWAGSSHAGARTQGWSGGPCAAHSPCQHWGCRQYTLALLCGLHFMQCVGWTQVLQAVPVAQRTGMECMLHTAPYWPRSEYWLQRQPGLGCRLSVHTGTSMQGCLVKHHMHHVLHAGPCVADSSRSSPLAVGSTSPGEGLAHGTSGTWTESSATGTAHNTDVQHSQAFVTCRAPTGS